MDELRVLAYLERLGVLDPLAENNRQDARPDGRPAGAADPGHGDAGEHGGSPDGGSPDGGSPDGGGTGGGGTGGGGTGGGGLRNGIPPGGLAAHVNLTVPLTAALRLADRPGQLSRIGPIDPALARDLTAAAARNPASTWCITVTGSDGRPVAHGCGRPPPRADREDRGPPGGYGTIRINTIAFTAGTDGNGGGGGGGDLVFTMEPLAGPCDHAHQAAGHDPGKMLRHLTGILNGTCTFPPCRRPEHQADYEHSKPYDQGGKTCLCDSGPVCRQEHRAKQATGWRLEQAGRRGWFRWITPSGRRYLSRPTQYPD
jgi:hypothetical protein